MQKAKSNTMLPNDRECRVKEKRYPLSVYHVQKKRKTLSGKRGRYPGITVRKKRIVGG
jgi:hypothetical protein